MAILISFKSLWLFKGLSVSILKIGVYTKAVTLGSLGSAFKFDL